MSKWKAGMLVAAAMLSFLPAHGNQETVKTTGIGVAESKAKACEIALDAARREAAQQATSLVESTTSSMESSNGVAQRSDQMVTTKSFAKLLEKSEKVSFDESSGQVSCEVTASFSAGFVEVSSADSQGAAVNTQNVSEFKAGEVFCSRIMDMCFREIYSKQLGEFGIQIIPTSGGQMGHNAGSVKGAFFNKLRFQPKSSEEKVTTQKRLIEILKELNSTQATPVSFYVQLYRLDSKRGFVRDQTSAGTQGFSVIMGAVRLPKTTPSESQDYVKSLDEKMALIQKQLEEI
ncbi:MAG: hypothetical protein LRY66_02285 [Saccharospirillaceae bacterium]|nr:hypothetical protein [Saccharospirillaceae bacterium]MCD8530191.1 hypothetical protein [Saccharospirillaceae bacterium]